MAAAQDFLRHTYRSHGRQGAICPSRSHGVGLSYGPNGTASAVVQFPLCRIAPTGAPSEDVMLFFRPAPTLRVFPPPVTSTPAGRRAAKLAAKHQRKLQPAQSFVRIEK